MVLDTFPSFNGLFGGGLMIDTFANHNQEGGVFEVIFL